MMPSRCPRGGFPLKSELLFAGLGGLPPQTVAVTYKAPCPARHRAHSSRHHRRHHQHRHR
jgi:hypothetical protein